MILKLFNIKSISKAPYTKEYEAFKYNVTPYFCVKELTPGKFLPSKYSKLAPPPVDT